MNPSTSAVPDIETEDWPKTKYNYETKGQPKVEPYTEIEMNQGMESKKDKLKSELDLAANLVSQCQNVTDFGSKQVSKVKDESIVETYTQLKKVFKTEQLSEIENNLSSKVHSESDDIKKEPYTEMETPENIDEENLKSASELNFTSKVHSDLGYIKREPNTEMESLDNLEVDEENLKLASNVETKLFPQPLTDNDTEFDTDLPNKSELDSTMEFESNVEQDQNNLPEASEAPKPTPVRKKRFSCEYCGMSFTKKSNYDKHLRIHTGEKPFKCNECDAAFTSKSNMNIHMRLHTGEKPYKCDLCVAAFVQKSHLIKHRTIHFSDKQMKCEFCSTIFTDTTAMLAHKKTHEGETPPPKSRLHKQKKLEEVDKPFKCEICDASFSSEVRLVLHGRVHSGEKPHKCQTCSATFSKRGSLTIHTRIHTGEKPFTCQHCNAAFSQKGSLTIHQKVHRGDYSADTATNNESPPTPTKSSKQSAESTPEKNITAKATKMTNGVKRKEDCDVKESSNETTGSGKKMKTKENAENNFALDPVDPVFSDFIFSMHQKANTGEITTEMLFQ